MEMTLYEKREKERLELNKRRERERVKIEKQLREALIREDVEVLEITEQDDCYKVKVAFVLDGYRQEDYFYWSGDESQEQFVTTVKRRVDYIKELRAAYPEYCLQNDFIQTNSEFKKTIRLTHMGWNRDFPFSLQLADYMKLPNRTSCSCGGGDYKIKQTPQRVKEYNQNINIVIDELLGWIGELKQRKYREVK